MQAARAACTGTAGAEPGTLKNHRALHNSRYAEQLPPKTTEARKSNAASYAVQAEVSPCTAHGERVLGRAASRVRFAASRP